jgi:hypothetical protein
MTIWVGQDPNEISDPSTFGPFDGCLVVMNIGKETYGDVYKTSPAYIEQVENCIADAHADGWLVLYLFDSDTGAQPQPEEFDFVEGMDFFRPMSSICGRKDSNFALLPDKRSEQFAEMKKQICSKFRVGSRVVFVGQCSIDSVKVLLPPTKG